MSQKQESKRAINRAEVKMLCVVLVQMSRKNQKENPETKNPIPFLRMRFLSIPKHALAS
jgi:hypothetical protein